MNETIILAIVLLVILGLLVWRFDAVKLSLDWLGMKTTAEGTRGAANAGSADASERGSTHASGDGSVAVGNGAEDAEIGTDVAGPARPAPPPPAATAGTAASGEGSVAIGGGANRAKINTKLRRPGGKGT